MRTGAFFSTSAARRPSSSTTRRTARSARLPVQSTDGSGHGALVGFLRDKGVDALICGGIGGGAQTALAQAGIRLYGGVSGDADEAVRALLDGRLAYDPDVRCGHHDHAHGEESHTCGAHGCGHGCKTDS